MIETTDATFHRDVLAAPLPVLVMFTATWCAPCKAMMPHVEQIALDYDGKLNVVTCDVMGSQQAAAMSGATQVPTLVLFRSGVVVDGRSGACSAATLRGLLEKHGVTT